MKCITLLAALLLVPLAALHAAEAPTKKPNIDRLASEGMRFTDAHAPGSACIPSRYGLMTGRYPFRNQGNMQPTKGALIEPARMTIASLLRDAGYATAMIGKWHLGFDGGDAFDYTKPLRGGPRDHGFDSFFGQHASLDIPPYLGIENDQHLQKHSTRPAQSPPAAPRPERWMMPAAAPDNGRCLRELFEYPDRWKEARSQIDVLGYPGMILDKQFTDPIASVLCLETDAGIG